MTYTNYQVRFKIRSKSLDISAGRKYCEDQGREGSSALRQSDRRTAIAGEQIDENPGDGGERRSKSDPQHRVEEESRHEIRHLVIRSCAPHEHPHSETLRPISSTHRHASGQ